MHFHIYVADSFVPMYLDMAVMLLYQIQQEGHTVQLTKWDGISNGISPVESSQIRRMKITENTQVVIFGNLFTVEPWIAPDGAVVTIFDCVEVMKNFMKSGTLRNNVILHYTPSDVGQYDLSQANLIFEKFSFIYSPYLDFSAKYPPMHDPEYDVIFIGNVSERRRVVLQQLSDLGLAVFNLSFGFSNPTNSMITGEDRAQLLAKSKVVLSLFAYENTQGNTLASRVFPAVSTQAFVISEASTTEYLNDDLKDVCHLVSYNNIVNDVVYFVRNNMLREQKRLEFYANVKAKRKVCDLSILTSKRIFASRQQE